LSWLDRLKLASGGAGLVGSTAGKVLGLGALVVSRLLWILLVGAGALCVRTVLGYRNVRARRDLQRTSNLYYQNLANNAGVIHSLISMVAQEEFKEALLAYAACANAVARLRAPQAGSTPRSDSGRGLSARTVRHPVPLRSPGRVRDRWRACVSGATPADWPCCRRPRRSSA